MGRKPSYTEANRAQVLKLHHAGLSGEAIADRVGLNRRTVDRIIAAAPASKRAKKPPPREDPGTVASALASVREVVPLLQRALEQAVKDDDAKTINQVTRTLNATLAQVARLEPPPPPDPNEHPDMVAAAARARAKLAEYIEKARAGKLGKKT